MLLVCLSSTTLLAACSNSANRPVKPTVGIESSTVALSTDGNATSIYQNTTINVFAAVSTSGSTGVTWTLSGQGMLSNVTTSSVTYVAPTSGVSGAINAVITATSNADSTQTASVTLVVLGSPVINNVTLFPAFESIAYGAAVSATGGTAPFTWVVSSGALPAGITLSTSTSSTTAITGTPTVTGTFSFTLQTTDANSAVASVPLTLVINNAQACLLQGQFAFLMSGFRGGGPATHAGVITIDANGNITGEQDYKDRFHTTHETLTSGICTNRSTNSGVLQLNAPSGSLYYNYSVTPPDSSSSINSARLQLIHSGSDTGTGELTRVDATALTGTAPAGNYAFGLVGFDGAGAHFGTIGQLTLAAGNVSSGSADSNDATASYTGQAVTGTVAAADSSGRGTLSLTANGQTLNLAYYTVNARKSYLIDIDAVPNLIRQTGYLTAQVGDLNGTTFDNAALATAAVPSVLSVWGALGSVEPAATVSLGRLSNGTAGSAGAGTVDAVVDSAFQATDSGSEKYTAQPYTITSNGRGTFTLANADGTRSFVFYLDGVSNGYLLEADSSQSGNAGLLEAQTVPAGGTFADTANGGFVAGTQFGPTVGPMILAPLVYLDFGSLSSSFTTGSFLIDSASGRGLGTLSETGIGTRAAALYLVSPSKIDLLTFATTAVDGSIEWLIQN